MKGTARQQPSMVFGLLILVLGWGCGDQKAAIPNPLGGDGGTSMDMAAGIDAEGGPPDVVSPATDSSGTIAFRVDGRMVALQARGDCVGGHQNFGATDGANAFFFSIFINKVGTYECTDALPYIFVQYRGPVGGVTSTPAVPASANFFVNGGTGPAYAFTASAGGAGQCTIAVSERRPRFKATFAATLDLLVGEGPQAITIESGQIDVATPAEGCL